MADGKHPDYTDAGYILKLAFIDEIGSDGKVPKGLRSQKFLTPSEIAAKVENDKSMVMFFSESGRPHCVCPADVDLSPAQRELISSKKVNLGIIVSLGTFKDHYNISRTGETQHGLDLSRKGVRSSRYLDFIL